MANYLTIDIGNTTAKAAIWSQDRCVGTPIWGQLSAADIEHLCSSLDGEVDCAAVCRVAEDTNGLLAATRRIARRVIEVSSSSPLPISLGRYTTAATLGPDRIAALCGAMAVCPGCEALVVDCGTCVTYDRLSASGEFLGGNIAPGIGMRMRAMHAFTAMLPLVDSASAPNLWGSSTATAMQAGAFYGIVAEIQYYMSQCPANTRLLLTGGRTADLSHFLSNISCSPCPMLVMQGLKHIIEHNENN